MASMAPSKKSNDNSRWTLKWLTLSLSLRFDSTPSSRFKIILILLRSFPTPSLISCYSSGDRWSNHLGYGLNRGSGSGFFSYGFGACVRMGGCLASCHLGCCWRGMLRRKLSTLFGLSTLYLRCSGILRSLPSEGSSTCLGGKFLKWGLE